MTKPFFENSPRQKVRAYLALFLPFLPTERLARAGGAPADAPFVLTEKRANALRLYALNAEALRQGLTPGGGGATGSTMALRHS